MTRQIFADVLMAGAVLLMLIAMFHLLRAMFGVAQASRAGYRGPWALWDLRAAEQTAPPAARPHLRAILQGYRRLWPWALASMALAVPAAILAAR